MNLRKTKANIFQYICVCFLVCCFFACTNEVTIIYDVSPQRFKKLLDDCEKNSLSYIIIDIRSKEEYLLGHIEDAINFPMSTLPNDFVEFEDFTQEMVFVYGHNLEESFKATTLLAENGFKKLYNVTGTDEAEYDFILHSAVRIVKGFEIAESENYQLVDYRRAYVRDQYFVAETCFVPYPELSLEKYIPYNPNGYVVFSTAKKTAKECAAELVACGFENVYYCVDNIINYSQYFSTNLEIKTANSPTEEDTDGTGETQPKKGN